MKRYIGKRLEEGCEIYVEEAGKLRPLSLRLELENKSPAGFEWGYSGSGPAQLALAILADLLGPDPLPKACPCCASPMDEGVCSEKECAFKLGPSDRFPTAFHLFQKFKRKVVGKLPRKEWTLDEKTIREWIAENRT